MRIYKTGISFTLSRLMPDVDELYIAVEENGNMGPVMFVSDGTILDQKLVLNSAPVILAFAQELKEIGPDFYAFVHGLVNNDDSYDHWKQAQA